MWVYFWRFLGIVALIFMSVTTILFWTAWRASSFKPIANGEPIQSGIDVISIQLDILSLIVGVVGVALAVFGFFGYQAIKAGAEDAAIRSATAKADEVATRAVALHMQNIPGTDSGTQQPVEPEILTEITEEEKGD